MSSVFQVSPEASGEPKRKTPEEIVEACFVATAEALSKTGVATDDEIFKALSRVRESHKVGEPVDLIDALARVQGHDEEHIGLVIESLSDAVALTLSPIPPCIPFASKLIAPSAFYDSFDAIHQLSKSLLSPVIYAEDTDAIGIASINPIAALILGDEILYAVGKRLDIRPFITTTRMEYESWVFLCRKHFELK